VPEITYQDLSRAVEWLERVFGFRERAEARLTWPGGGMTWIEVGSGLFNVSTPREAWWQGPDPGCSWFVVKVYFEDVDGHITRAKAEGAEIISEPQDGFGMVGAITRLITREIVGISRSAAATWRLSAGNCLLA
jgi:uncharacterized glyoxalase superfamily protein PhnB